MGPEDLENYLDTLGESGQFDSQGFFTLDLEKSSLKLQRHLLENPEDYLLLAVRAGVAGGASAMKISLNYKEVCVEYSMEEELLSVMMDGFVHSQDERSRAAQILLLSVGGSFDQEVSEVQISWPGVRLTADGTSMKGEPFDGRPGVVSISFARGGLGFLKSRERTAGEHRALSERCAFASIPVSLDGRRLSGGEASVERLAEGKSGLPDGLVLAEAFLRFRNQRLDKKPNLRPVAAVCQKSFFTRDPSWQALPGSVFLRILEPDFGAYFYLNRLYGKGELHVVKDGVCLEPVTDKFWLPGSRLVVRSEELDTDMTQLRPRDSEALEALKEWATEQNLKICRHLGEQLPYLRGPDPIFQRMKYSLVTGGWGLLVGAIGGPGSAVVLGGLSAAAGFALLSARDGLPDRVKGYLSNFEALRSSSWNP